MVPLFPRLRVLLNEAWDLAPEGSSYVIRRYRDTESNLRTQLDRLIRRAGYVPWPKAFMNLRASCRTDLERIYPRHVVNRWLGHGSAVAERHYLMDTDEEWNRAAQVDDFVPTSGVKSGAVPAAQQSSMGGEGEETPVDTTTDDCGLPKRYSGSNGPREDSRDGNGYRSRWKA